MLNQAMPALASTSKSGRTLVLRLPSSNPPPCTRIAAGKGPGPSGTCKSSSNGCPSGLPYSTAFCSIASAAKVIAQPTAIARILLVTEKNCNSYRCRLFPGAKKLADEHELAQVV